MQAVWSEPVSVRIRCLTGKIQGNSRFKVPGAEDEAEERPEFSHSFVNSPVSEQGNSLADQGILFEKQGPIMRAFEEPGFTNGSQSVVSGLPLQTLD